MPAGHSRNSTPTIQVEIEESTVTSTSIYSLFLRDLSANSSIIISHHILAEQHSKLLLCTKNLKMCCEPARHFRVFSSPVGPFLPNKMDMVNDYTFSTYELIVKQSGRIQAVYRALNSRSRHSNPLGGSTFVKQDGKNSSVNS